MKRTVVSLCVDKGEEEKKDKDCMKTSAFKKWRMVKVLLKMARFIAPRLKAPFIHRGGWKELSPLPGDSSEELEDSPADGRIIWFSRMVTLFFSLLRKVLIKGNCYGVTFSLSHLFPMSWTQKTKPFHRSIQGSWMAVVLSHCYGKLECKPEPVDEGIRAT